MTPLRGWYLSLPFLPATPSSPSRTLEGLFELAHRPSRAFDLPRALLPVLQRYQNTVGRASLAPWSQDTVKINWRKPWLCVCWKYMLLQRSLVVKSQRKRIELVTIPARWRSPVTRCRPRPIFRWPLNPFQSHRFMNPCWKERKKVFQKLICNWLHIKHAKFSFTFLGVETHWAATLMYFMSMLKVLQKGAVTFTPTPFAYFTSFHHCMIGGTQDESVEKIPFCQYNTIPSYSLPSLRY